MASKNFNELEDLLDKIQSKTKHTLAKIAATIEISKEHLVRSKKNPAINSKKTIGLLREAYRDVLKEEENRILDSDQIRTLNASVGILIGEVAFLRSLATGESPEVIQQRLKKACQDAIKNL